MKVLKVVAWEDHTAVPGGDEVFLLLPIDMTLSHPHPHVDHDQQGFCRAFS